MSFTRQIVGFVGWLVVTAAAAGIGGYASANAPDFYGSLVRPAWAPPAWLFGPVWSVLYLLMAIAAWLVWRVGGFRGAPAALSLYLIQLVLNALWTWLFFTWRQGALSFAEIVLLWILIVATIVAFWRIRPVAALLLVPYAAWTTYATALTFAIWRLNPHLLG